MGDWRRHAIYFAPPAGSALARFAAAWLGWDPEAGTTPARPPDVPADVIAEPARYGFHATLKAPFRLAEGASLAALDAAAGTIAASLPAFDLRLALAAPGRFVALVADTPPPALSRLESALVTGLDGFRAPLTPAETARRQPERLDDEARALLAAWGYPHVLGRFHFHMTLTGPLDADALAATHVRLARDLGPLLAEPLPVDAVCRFSEAPDGRFHLLRRFPLRG